MKKLNPINVIKNNSKEDEDISEDLYEEKKEVAVEYFNKEILKEFLYKCNVIAPNSTVSLHCYFYTF